ncbi:tetratricopeptide repeat protein [Haloferula sargassicola]|uniref:Tetratricopeptide repeat-like domain-containing protein n=1 Tax=Haloferula sargassicola TaxID=490096 RepID=A0ABP9UTE1_9BACT
MDESHADPKPIAEISHGPSAFEQFLDKNQKLLIAIGIVLAIAAGAWVVKDGIDRGAREDGGRALVDAETTDQLKAVMEEHAATPAAASAAVLLSDRQWEEGQQSSSLETLRAEIAGHPDHPATIPAKARLAARLHEMGETDEAKSTYESLVSDPQADWIAPYALVSLAEIAREGGDIDAAKSYLDDAREKYPLSAFSSTIQSATRFVDFTMPKEIDPPAPAATEDAALPDTSSLQTPPNPMLENLTSPSSIEMPAPEVEESAPAAEGTPADENAAEPAPAGE